VWDQVSQRVTRLTDLPFAAGNSPTSLDISPDGCHAAISTFDNGVCIVDMKTGRIAAKLDIPGKTVRFSESGDLLACGTGDGRVLLYSVPDYSLHTSIEVDDRLVDCVDVSSDGRWVAAVGFDRYVKLYSRATERLSSFPQRLAAFPCLVRFSPDGERLMTGSVDGKVQLWIRETGDLTMSWQFPAASWPAGEFSRDGESIVVSGVNLAHAMHAPHADRLRPLSIAVLRSRACQQAPGER
ncbi:MAG: hypothetical protein AAF961_18455, partial [Planctomycetota bacterium]